MDAPRSSQKATDWSGVKSDKPSKEIKLSWYQSIYKNHFWVHVKFEVGLSIPFTRKLSSIKKWDFFQGECYRQNHPDRTNLRILNFADNKDLHGGGLSESLTSVPVIDGTWLEMKIKPPLPTHPSINVCLCTSFQTPIGYKIIFLLVLLFCSFFPSSLLFCLHCHSLYSTTSNERTNELTVTLLFSRHVHLLLTITNFLPFASLLFLLTLDRLRRWRRQ
jgi:hypothetical protein